MKRLLERAWLLLIAIALASPARATADPDVSVGWISRSPKLDWISGSLHPDRDGWPVPGETVSWQAHVRNWAPAGRSVVFEWLQDGKPVLDGSLDLPPDGWATAELPWTWTFDRHRLTFVLPEPEKSLSVFTDALSVGFYVEQGFYDFFRANQPLLGVDSFSFEDFAQRQIGRFNEMAALAQYPESPSGVLDRFRIDEIVVVPDGALPLVPLPNAGEMDGQPNGSTHPNTADRTVDLEWGFPADTVRFYASDLETAADTNPFYFSGSLLHELGHARYLVDVYGWNVWSHRGDDGSEVAITESGRPVVGTSRMPSSGPYVYFTPEQGLMNQDYTFIDRYSAVALNLIAGRRAVSGNSNEPANIGAFLNDLPAQNRVTIRDPFGTPLAGADVRIYQATGVPGHYLTKYYDDVPDLELETDSEGRMLVGRCPFASDGVIVHDFGESNVTAIVRVEKSGVVRYGFLESRLFNLAYWRGESQFAEHDLTVGLPVCFPTRPALESPPTEAFLAGPDVVLKWSGGFHVSAYRIWVSQDYGPAVAVATVTPTTHSLHLAVHGRVAWWVEVFTFDGCPPSRSETGLFNAPPSRKRSDVRLVPRPPDEPAAVPGR